MKKIIIACIIMLLAGNNGFAESVPSLDVTSQPPKHKYHKHKKPHHHHRRPIHPPRPPKPTHP